MSKQKSPFNHGDKEARHRRACERLGTEDPRCILCHEINPHALQLHHVAGRAYDEDELVALCHNHHARVSDGQKDHPLKIPDCINPLEGLGHFDRGLRDIVFIDHRVPVVFSYSMSSYKNIVFKGDVCEHSILNFIK